MLAKHMTDAELRVVAGWDAGNQQARTYLYRSGADTEGKLLRISGVKDEKMEAVATTATTPKDCAAMSNTQPTHREVLLQVRCCT